jgi:chromosome partitioning protein
MGLFNRKYPEGRREESQTSREPQNAEPETRADDWGIPDRGQETADLRIEAAAADAPATDPFGDELRELEEKAAADEPAPEPVAEPQSAKQTSTERPPSGKLDKEELRRAVKGPADAASEEGDDDGRRSADDLIGPTMNRRHPFAPDSGERAPERTMKVFAFANQKGGVAKTTTTLNLAVALSESGHRVLAVDLDPQGNLTMSQGLNPDTIERSMYDVLVHKIPIEDIIVEREIDLAVSSIDLAGAELSLSAQIGRERALQKALVSVLDRYDYVLMDTPPSLGLLTINAFVAAGGVIVPVQCEYLSLRGLVQLENTLAMVRENLNPEVEIVGILPTMFDRRTTHAREAIEILQENFGGLVYNTKIRKTVRFAEAPVNGSSVLAYDPTGEAAELYRDLAKEVLNGAKAREHA